MTENYGYEKARVQNDCNSKNDPFQDQASVTSFVIERKRGKTTTLSAIEFKGS